MNHCLSGALFLIAALTGCSADKKADAAQPPARKPGSVAPRPAVVTDPKSPYTAVAVTNGVKLTGTVDFDGVIPADSVITMTPDQAGCGPSVTDRRVEHSGTRIGGTIVWITDIRSGKALPIERRFEVVNEDCLLSPRVQAVITPGTLDVASEDVAMHHDRIINVATGELEGTAPFNDNGEVVPFDSLLTGTKQLEISCKLHPWAKAWILVLDHPYFATTDGKGSFSIDGIPPGTYNVKAWHPLLGVAEQSLTVVAGKPATLALKLVQAPATTPASPGT
jgi:hypothetical protein